MDEFRDQMDSFGRKIEELVERFTSPGQLNGRSE
jgi:hypothetical protein